MSDILLTIAIPTYNRSKCLGRAIDSALSQVGVNLEVIVSDNASSDDTLSVMSKYKDNTNVKYIRNSFNIGAVANYNQCLNKASGVYFMILGDDDWLSENYAQSLIDTLKDRNGVFFGKCIAITPNEKILHESSDSSYESSGLDFYNSLVNRDPEIARHAWFMLAAKTSILRTAGGFPYTDNASYSDNLLLLKLALDLPVYYRPDAVIYYSVYPESYGNANVSALCIAVKQAFDFWDRELAPVLVEKYGNSLQKELRRKEISSFSLMYLGRVFRYGGGYYKKIRLLLSYPHLSWLIMAILSKPAIGIVNKLIKSLFK